MFNVRKKRSVADYDTEIRGVHIELAFVLFSASGMKIVKILKSPWCKGTDRRYALSVLHSAVCQQHT